MRHAKPWALSLVLAVSMLACSFGQGGESTDRFEHANGLIVEVLEQGTGPAIEAGQTAVMHYTGWLDAGGLEKGEKFDSSRDRGQRSARRLPQRRAARARQRGTCAGPPRADRRTGGGLRIPVRRDRDRREAARPVRARRLPRLASAGGVTGGAFVRISRS